jgi:hypothetical protein
VPCFFKRVSSATRYGSRLLRMPRFLLFRSGPTTSSVLFVLNLRRHSLAAPTLMSIHCLRLLCSGFTPFAWPPRYNQQSPLLLCRKSSLKPGCWAFCFFHFCRRRLGVFTQASASPFTFFGCRQAHLSFCTST